MGSDKFALAELKWSQSINDLLESLTPQQRAILGLLAISDHTKRSPMKLLSQLGCELPGKMGFDLIDMANLLAAGNELFKTLEQFPRLVPPQAVILLRLARDQGLLEYSYDLIRQRFPRLDRPREIGVGSGISLFLKAVITIGVVSFFLIKVVPELTKILEEFKIESNRFATALSYVNLAVEWLTIPLALLGLGLLAYVVSWSYVRGSNLLFKGVRPWQNQAASKSVTRKRFLASLADSGALSSLIERFSSSASFNRLLPRLNAVRNRLLQGGDDWSALADQNLISRSDANLLCSASPETQAWLMRWKAANQERKIERNWTNFGRIAWILIQVAVVVVVLLVCMMVFGSLVDVMTALSNSD